MNDKICLTTYIYGIRYQAYIPFLVYTCHSAYPEYDIRLFLYDSLDKNVKDQLDSLNVSNLYITERCFSDCPQMTPLKSKSLRWVLWDDAFLDYDYLYVVDIDMLYIREPLALHLQHIEHMKTTGLPYDNLARCFHRKPFQLHSIGYRLKHAGYRSFFRYLFGTRDDYRLSGLHFIQVQPYYKLFNADVRTKYKKMIYDGSFVSLTLSSNNEAFLYQIIKQTIPGIERVAIQTESYKMLDFNNYTRPEFRPHHGIHLGIFRQDLRGRRKTILDCETYKYYLQHFQESYLTDTAFLQLCQQSPSFIKEQFNNLFNYYNINASFNDDEFK